MPRRLVDARQPIIAILIAVPSADVAKNYPHRASVRSDESDDFFEQFKRELIDVDDVATVILKGHLLIESSIEDIISAIFLHPKNILDGRFGFERKVRIARSMSLNASTNRDWDLILSLNSLRNEIVHRQASDERQQKIEKVRRMVLSQMLPAVAKAHESDSDVEIGRVIGKGLAGDEMGERVYLVVDGVDGRVHHMEFADPARTDEVRRSTIVESAPAVSTPRPSDRSIAFVADGCNLRSQRENHQSTSRMHHKICDYPNCVPEIVE